MTLYDYFNLSEILEVNVDGEELTYNDELVIEVCEAGVSCYGEL